MHATLRKHKLRLPPRERDHSVRCKIRCPRHGARENLGRLGACLLALDAVLGRLGRPPVSVFLLQLLLYRPRFLDGYLDVFPRDELLLLHRGHVAGHLHYAAEVPEAEGEAFGIVDPPCDRPRFFQHEIDGAVFDMRYLAVLDDFLRYELDELILVDRGVLHVSVHQDLIAVSPYARSHGRDDVLDVVNVAGSDEYEIAGHRLYPHCGAAAHRVAPDYGELLVLHRCEYMPLDVA